MRILLVTSMVPDPHGIGAIPQLLAAELAGLSERHELTLLAPFGADPDQVEAAAALERSALDAHLVDRRPSPRPARRWRRRAELLAASARRGWPWRVALGATGMQPILDQLLASHEFDLVAIEDNPLAALRLPANLPRVLTEHEATRAPAADWRRGPLRQRPARLLGALDRRRWDRFLPRVWRGFDLLQVFSAADAVAAGEAAPELAGRVRVNPFGIVMPAAADPGRERPGTVLFSGTFSHPPNREAAIWLAREIMPAIRARRPDARLRLVGHGPPAEILALRGPGVEVVPDAAEIGTELERAAVVLAPVRSGGGMRMKVLEAMARGKAVVTTPLGAAGFTELGEPPPLLLADASEQLAEATLGLLEDRGRRLALGRDGRAFALRHHTPAAWAGRLERVYAEAIDRHRGEP